MTMVPFGRDSDLNLCLLIQVSLTLQEIISGVNASDPELCFQATQAARYHQTDLYH